jgi:hypothetical protein
MDVAHNDDPEATMKLGSIIVKRGGTTQRIYYTYVNHSLLCQALLTSQPLKERATAFRQ